MNLAHLRHVWEPRLPKHGRYRRFERDGLTYFIPVPPGVLISDARHHARTLEVHRDGLRNICGTGLASRQWLDWRYRRQVDRGRILPIHRRVPSAAMPREIATGILGLFRDPYGEREANAAREALAWIDNDRLLGVATLAIGKHSVMSDAARRFVRSIAFDRFPAGHDWKEKCRLARMVWREVQNAYGDVLVLRLRFPQWPTWTEIPN